MNCVFCGMKNMDVIVLVPVCQLDGSLSSLACLPCSIQKGLYCEKHDRPHIGFDDGTTACIFCIDNLVKREMYRAHELTSKICEVISNSEIVSLNQAAGISSEVTGDSKDFSVLRFVASRAQRSKLSIDEVISKIVEKESCQFILSDSLVI
jgi:hypothetical protein